MAIQSITFSKLKNYASTTGNLTPDNLKRTVTTNVTPSGSAIYAKDVPNKASRYNLYEGDYFFIKNEGNEEGAPHYIGTQNPAYYFLGGIDGHETLKEHTQEYINKFKTMELAFCKGGFSSKVEGGVLRPLRRLPTNDSSMWGNWRDPSQKGNSYIAVDPKIILFPKNNEFSFQFDHTLTGAYKPLSENGIVKKVNDTIETLRTAAMASGKATEPLKTGGKMMPMMEMVPQWTGTTPLKFNGDLTFEFNFGKYGLFSGEHEVVRPILALACMIAPDKVGNYAWGPAPTGSTYQYYLAKAAAGMVMEGGSILGNAFSGIEDLISGGFEMLLSGGQKGGGDVTSGLKKFTSLQEDLFNRINTALAQGLNYVKTVHIRMGRLIFGPVIIKGVNFKFDFTHTDEYGFPYKGEIILSGIEQVFYPTQDSFVAMFDGLPGEEPANLL